jgi:Tfp pilus assembly protein PilX
MKQQAFHASLGQAGSALVVSLLLTMIVLVISTGLAVSTRGGERIASAFKNQQSAFEVAVAGLENAREAIRAARFNDSLSTSFTTMLESAAASGTTLVDSTARSSFGAATNGAVNGTSPENTPQLGPTSLDGSSYQVFLTNAGADAVTSTTDTDDTVTLTSFASGPNTIGFAVVQAAYAPDPLLDVPTIPGLLTMPGRDISLNLPNSQATMDGNGGGTPPNNKCYATIAVTNSSLKGGVQGKMKRDSNYTTCIPGSSGTQEGIDAVDNFLQGINPYDGSTNTPNLQAGDTNLTSVSYLTSLYTQLRAVADYTEASGSIDFGSASRPTLVVYDGDLRVGPGQHYGILIVKGNLTLDGNAAYTGSIFAIGPGYVLRDGGGNGYWCGGLLIANTDTPDASNSSLVGTPTYTTPGGGDAQFGAACPAANAGGLVRFGRPLKRLSFQQLR